MLREMQAATIRRQRFDEAGAVRHPVRAIAGKPRRLAAAIGKHPTRGLAAGWGKPVVGVNHLWGHIYAALLTDPSLDILSRCGLKLSRGKDQLMCYGENMPLDVLFVRDDDIPDLVRQLNERYSGLTPIRFNAAAMRALVRAPWPGNIRQLENVVRGIAATGNAREISAAVTRVPVRWAATRPSRRMRTR